MFDSTYVRTATTFHPLVLNHEKSLLEQAKYEQNLVTLKKRAPKRELKNILLNRKKIGRNDYGYGKWTESKISHALTQGKESNVLVFFFFCIIVTIKGDKLEFLYSRSF